MTDSARIHTWGCERHKENTYEGCASCDLEDFSELSFKVIAAVARIAELERALHQIKNGCVDDDDVANELFRSSPAEIRKIAVNALAGLSS